MALRSTLDEIVEMARDEARISTNSTRSVDHLAHVRQLVRRHYNSLLDDFSWKHLVLKREDAMKPMSAGQRYYDFPADLNIMKFEAVWFLWGNQWCRLTEGIGLDQYNIKDSESDERSDPAERWAWYGHNQFEIWPIPASGAGKVSFEGQKKGEKLVDGTNRADLDDIMVSLYVAGELLNENKQKDAAAAKISLANNRRGRMLASASISSSGATLGGTDPKTSPVRSGINIEYIRSSG